MMKEKKQNAVNKPVRILIPVPLWNRVKDYCPEHGDVSRLIRNLLRKHLNAMDVEEEAAPLAFDRESKVENE